MTTQQNLKADWFQIKGNIKEKWGKLTDDDIAQIDGNKDKLVGLLIKQYSMERDAAQKEVDRFWKM